MKEYTRKESLAKSLLLFAFVIAAAFVMHVPTYAASADAMDLSNVDLKSTLLFAQLDEAAQLNEEAVDFLPETETATTVEEQIKTGIYIEETEENGYILVHVIVDDAALLADVFAQEGDVLATQSGVTLMIGSDGSVTDSETDYASGDASEAAVEIDAMQPFVLAEDTNAAYGFVSGTELYVISGKQDAGMEDLAEEMEALGVTYARYRSQSGSSDALIEDGETVSLSEEMLQAQEVQAQLDAWNGSALTASAGVNQGPSGRETYYNLDMSGVISIMRSLGYSEEEYPYWVREDGVKMFGDYVMVAAELSSRPKGTILPCSLGVAMVVDTGGFASSNPTQLDIATAW